MRNSKNMKKVHKVALCSVMQILTQSRAQDWRYQLYLFVSYVQPLWLYTGICRMNTCMNNTLNQFITAQEVYFLIISILFSFLCISSSITGKVANKKFWKITDYCYMHPLYHNTNFSPIRSLQLKKWIS